MKAPEKILLVVTRRIGDVLLATPLMRSLHRAWPDAKIDVLVFAGTEGVLAGNPDIRHVLPVKHRLPFREHLRFLASLWRKYDLALSAFPGDRPTLYACIAGKYRVGMIPEEGGQQWKKWLLSRWIPFDNTETHTVLMNLGLAKLLGIAPCFEVAAAWKREDEKRVLDALPFDPDTRPYAVLHVYPMYAYKMWQREAWAELAGWLEKRGLRIVLTGGAGPEEQAYIQDLLALFPEDAVDVSGKLNLGGVAYLLSRASAYVGPDTAVTHMAASLGIPTVALFGPSNPVKWGPWPKGYLLDKNPYRMKGTQRVNNVVLLQGRGECVPCMEEGCDRNISSSSACLQNLPAASAIAALEEILK